MVRSLLSIGNKKLGISVAHFDVPARITCPGRTPACFSACYARKGRFVFSSVKDRLTWCFEQSRLPGFARKLVREVRTRGIMHFRWHSAGDVYDAVYASKMLRVMRSLPRVRFWLYSRSYRIPDILPLLSEMALLPNCKVWFSVDRDTGIPEVPPNVRLAYMQDRAEAVEKVDLVFRTRGMLSLPMIDPSMGRICPADTPSGRKNQTTCGGCGFCFDD